MPRPDRGRRRAIVPTLLLLFAGAACSPPADAQGLLSRIRQRIRSGPWAVPPPPVAPIKPYAPAPAPAPAPANPYFPNPAGRSIAPLGSDYQSYRTPLPGRPPAATLGSPTTPENSPSLGLRVTSARSGRYQGLEVQQVLPGSRANEVGVRPGDLIVEVQGRPVSSINDLADLLARRRVGDDVEARIVRNSTLYRAAIPLVASVQAPLPPPELALNLPPGGPVSTLPREQSSDPIPPVPVQSSAPPPSLGIVVQEIAGQRGTRITQVSDRSAGQAMGLRVGDRIVSVDGRLIAGTPDLVNAMGGRTEGDIVRLNVVRNEQMIALTGPLAGPDGELPTSPDLASSTPSSTPAPAPENGLLGGVGSILGGMFNRPRANPPTPIETPEAELPAPMTNTPLVPSTPTPMDPLALPDDPAGVVESFP